MRTIGLIGGMSWESTALYYQVINREIAARRGGLHSARLHLRSVDFAGIAARQQSGDWPALGEQLAAEARALEQGGADCVLIATNTMHRVAPEVEAALTVPLLHIADAAADAIAAAGLHTVLLLGTRYTMEQPFLRERLAARGITCRVPEEADRADVHRIIFDELCRGQVRDESRACLQQLIERQHQLGAEGVVLACTELTMLVSPDDVALPLFDTMALHAMAAVAFALG